MKKKLLIITGCIGLLLFTSCDFLDNLLTPPDQNPDIFPTYISYPLDYQYESEDIITYNNHGSGYSGDLYMMKYNLSKETIPEEETGYAVIDYPALSNKIKKINNTDVTADYSSVDSFQRKQWEAIAKLPDYVPDNIYRAVTPVEEKDYFYIYKKINREGKVKASIGNNTLSKEYEGKYCTVYYSNILDSSYAKSSNIYGKLQDKDKFKLIADTFDSIYALETKYLGSNEYKVSNTSKYANTDTKVHIIIHDINSDSTDRQTSLTLGYYSPEDLVKASRSGDMNNEAQILYLDSYALLNFEKMLLSTVVHEFNHMLNDINKIIKNGNQNSNDMKTWFTEMLSMVAEDMFAEKLNIPERSTPKKRLSDDFSDSYYLGFTTWFTGENVFYSYANAFAYGSFLVRNYGGVKLLSEIATNNYLNEQAITNALKKLGYKVNFEESVKNYYRATLNMNSTGLTFNRRIRNNNDGLGFSPIDLDELDAIPGLASSDDQFELWPTGCTIHYLGNEIYKLHLIKPIDENVEIEILCY